MSRPVRCVPVSSGPGSTSRTAPVAGDPVHDLLAALGAALDGTGPAVLPVPADEPLPAQPGDVPDDVALVVRTSGSTGTPRDVLLPAAALRASGEATAARLGGHGRWLLALPPVHVAGVQVLVRSLLAGTAPVVLAPGPFRAEAFTRAVGELDAPGTPVRRYTSLVPTQLHRLLGSPGALDALRTFDAVLVGGAATAARLLADARAAGVRVVTTYGMSESCGGCVYDGVPLDSVSVDLDATGRVLLAGPVLAAGYRDRPDLDAEAFVVRDGRRWLRTGDLGELVPSSADRADGRDPPAGPPVLRVLRVLGRADDVLVTGGAKVAPAAVERVVGALDGVADVCVVGLPDAEWGQSVTAVLVLHDGARAPAPEDVRTAVARSLGHAAAPRAVVVVDSLPLRGPGKPDRAAVAQLAADRLGR
ncbi:o-succinylbenzoate--CoA ligase [Cellulomonas cellasea]|uniref:O-succinylbenzoic acid--CoA ligase n=1 Tax=Cellulomonas cellasea TaxID=43670 RepID=A0A4Y3KTX2_9CELL|nr:o-succinylbenzoate--CoA ligase [Cellulomonas cellasea]GEA86390.1 O-succinylbenzoic acid--CoA ligase [Cellulomonas cellasea]